MSGITSFYDEEAVRNEVDTSFKGFFKNPNAVENVNTRQYNQDDFYKLSQVNEEALANARQIRVPFDDSIKMALDQAFLQYILAVDLGKSGEVTGSGPYGQYFECICGVFYDDGANELVICVENRQGEPLSEAPSQELIAEIGKVIGYVKSRFGFDLVPEGEDEEPIHILDGQLAYFKDAGTDIHSEHMNPNLYRGGGKWGVKKELPSVAFMNRFSQRGKAEPAPAPAPAPVPTDENSDENSNDENSNDEEAAAAAEASRLRQEANAAEAAEAARLRQQEANAAAQAQRNPNEKATRCPDLSDDEIKAILAHQLGSKNTAISAINLLEGALKCEPIDDKLIGEIINKILTIEDEFLDDELKTRLTTMFTGKETYLTKEQQNILIVNNGEESDEAAAAAEQDATTAATAAASSEIANRIRTLVDNLSNYIEAKKTNQDPKLSRKELNRYLNEIQQLLGDSNLLPEDKNELQQNLNDLTYQYIFNETNYQKMGRTISSVNGFVESKLDDDDINENNDTDPRQAAAAAKRAAAEQAAEEAANQLMDPADRPETQYPTPEPIESANLSELLITKEPEKYTGNASTLEREPMMNAWSRELNMIENLILRKESYTPTVSQNQFAVYDIDEYVNRLMDLNKIYNFYQNINQSTTFILANMFRITDFTEKAYNDLNTKTIGIIGIDNKIIKDPIVDSDKLYKAFGGSASLQRMNGTLSNSTPYAIYYQYDRDLLPITNTMGNFKSALAGRLCPKTINELKINITNGTRNGKLNRLPGQNVFGLNPSELVDSSFMTEDNVPDWRASLYILINTERSIQQDSTVLPGTNIEQYKIINYAIEQNTIKDIAPQLMYLINKEKSELMQRLFGGNMVPPEFYINESTNNTELIGQKLEILNMTWFAICHMVANVTKQFNTFYALQLSEKMQLISQNIPIIAANENTPLSVYQKWIGEPPLTPAEFLEYLEFSNDQILFDETEMGKAIIELKNKTRNNYKEVTNGVLDDEVILSINEQIQSTITAAKTILEFADNIELSRESIIEKYNNIRNAITDNIPPKIERFNKYRQPDDVILQLLRNAADILLDSIHVTNTLDNINIQARSVTINNYVKTPEITADELLNVLLQKLNDKSYYEQVKKLFYLLASDEFKRDARKLLDIPEGETISVDSLKAKIKAKIERLLELPDSLDLLKKIMIIRQYGLSLTPFGVSNINVGNAIITMTIKERIKALIQQIKPPKDLKEYFNSKFLLSTGISYNEPTVRGPNPINKPASVLEPVAAGTGLASQLGNSTQNNLDKRLMLYINKELTNIKNTSTNTEIKKLSLDVKKVLDILNNQTKNPNLFKIFDTLYNKRKFDISKLKQPLQNKIIDMNKLILNIEGELTDSILNRAYRKLIITSHPNKYGNPEEFKIISGAYEFLKQQLNPNNNFSFVPDPEPTPVPTQNECKANPNKKGCTIMGGRRTRRKTKPLRGKSYKLKSRK